MAKNNTRVSVEFPCGYKAIFDTDFRIGFMDIGKVEESVTTKSFLVNLPVCPLHGKNCPPKKK